MSYPWNQIEEVIERTEYERVLSELSLLEQQEGFVRKQLTLTDRTRRYLDFLGRLSVGVSVGIFAVIFNFLLFNWLLHIDVNPQADKPFEKKFKEPSAIVDHTLAQQNKLGTSEYGDKEGSKEAKHAFESVAQYTEQSAAWVSHTVKAGTGDVMKGARLVADKLLKSAGWGTEGTEVGKGIKKTSGVLPEEGLVKEKEEAKKEVNEFQQNNDPLRTVYALQVGAFKDYSNADALKTRLIKRGYNAYVTFAGSESKERIFKLYKVWIGEFKDMENAERVAIEIEKAEGMQALVTLKEGQESIR